MIFYFAIAGLLSVLLLGFKAQVIGETLGIMDNPLSEQHKLHKTPTPLVGAVLVSAALIFLVADHIVSGHGRTIAAIAGAAVAIGGLGVIDDRVKLSWHTRFIFLWAIIIGLLMLVPDLILEDLRWSWGQTTELGVIWGATFTALCLVGLVIALNMMDGYNGGVLSQCMVWTTIFALLASGTNQGAYLYLAAVVAIIMAFNLRGKLFLGDGGAYALGLLMGAAAIATYATPGAPVYADTIVVWLALPVFDCLRVIFRRKLRGESPFLPQRDHIHHLLMAIKGPGLALTFAAGFTLTFGSLSVIVPHYSYLLVLAELATIGMVVAVTSRMGRPQPMPAE